MKTLQSTSKWQEGYRLNHVFQFSINTGQDMSDTVSNISTQTTSNQTHYLLLRETVKKPLCISFFLVGTFSDRSDISVLQNLPLETTQVFQCILFGIHGKCVTNLQKLRPFLVCSLWFVKTLWNHSCFKVQKYSQMMYKWHFLVSYRKLKLLWRPKNQK